MIFTTIIDSIRARIARRKQQRKINAFWKEHFLQTAKLHHPSAQGYVLAF